MLILENLGMRNADGAEVLRNIELAIEPGEVVAVVGGPELGRRALLRLIAGLEQPSTGRVLLDGKPLAGPGADVGMVFSQPRLLSWLRVADNVGLCLEPMHFADRAARVEAELRRVGLAGHGGRWPAELPDGKAHRVALARALAVRPRVLLLEDPFAELDADERMELQDGITQLWEGDRPAMILATRDVEEAALLADRVVVLRSRPGRIDRVIEMSRPRARDSHRLAVAKRRLARVVDRLPVVPVRAVA
ncbi:ABC transporter ATP-binding protein [Zavarzinia compransoris]|uniref:ABC transporter ATP-binding protein n=1 Tax=Zavarzinia marina TaxID=2911065 RepID=UPI001F19640E|nr:ABC transporter ATP-binding protein [Zavarzinia marina]MCF4166963.1 ABC transporter ATP-binding protein [Zavarzinia marina]